MQILYAYYTPTSRFFEKSVKTAFVILFWFDLFYSLYVRRATTGR